MARKQSKRMPQPPQVNRSPRPQTSAQLDAPPTQDPGLPVLGKPLLDQELAISQESAIANRFELLQYNPDDLFTKRGVRTLEKMATTDDTISMCLASLKMMALSAGYEIEAASDGAMDERIADEVAANFDNLEGSLREKLYSVMGTLDIGVSFHEKIWGRWPVDHPDYADNIRLVTLKSKNPQWFNMAVDDFNNITGFVMISPPAYGRKLPARKVLYYSGQKRYENNWGTARIRALYDWWYIKGVAKAAIAVLLKKYGKETPIGYVPTTMGEADKQSFLDALVNLATTAAATVPEGTKIEWAKFDPTNMESCLKVIEKADQQMTKVLLGQVSSTGTSSVGAHGSSGGNQQGGSSKGGAQEQTLNMYLEYITSDIAENPFAELIKEIVDYNYEGVTSYPRFKFKKPDDRDLTTNVQTYIAAATAQVGGTPDVPKADGSVKPGKPGKGLVTWDEQDEEWIRQCLGAPSAGDKTTLRPRKQGRPRVAVPLPPVDPRQFPLAGYRPPTPSAPGLPANYAEPKPARPLTRYEKHFDFSEAWRIVDTEGEDEIAQAAAKVLHAAVDELKLAAKAAMGDSGKIRDLQMPRRDQLGAVLRDGLLDVARKATRQAKREVRARQQAAKLAEVHNLGGLTPDEVLKLIDDRAFTMAGKISDDVLADVKQTLYNGVKNGKSYKDIVYDVEAKLAKYVDMTQQPADLAQHRLMNVVRTNVMTAYNDARKAVYEDPRLDGFTVAYQFSSVLDGDTTAWCAEMGSGGPDGGGRIFKVTNPIWNKWTPPTWYQCRSVLVPITKVDGWDGEESEEPAEEPPEGFN